MRKKRRKPTEKKKRRKKKGKIKLPHSTGREGEFHLRFGHLLLNFFEVNILGGGAAVGAGGSVV